MELQRLESISAVPEEGLDDDNFNALQNEVDAAISNLGGENKRDLSSFNFSISTHKKENFTGIKKGDKS